MPSLSSTSNNNNTRRDSDDEDEKISSCTCNMIECEKITDGKDKTLKNLKWLGCKKRYHGTFQKLQAADINHIERLQKNGVRWYCSICVQTMAGTEEKEVDITSYREINTRMEKR